MAQIVAEALSSMCDPFTQTMAKLRQLMVQHFGAALNPELHYGDHFDMVVVEGSEAEIVDLVHTLRRKGCVDIEVYTEDPVTLRLLADSYSQLFRIFHGRWTPSPNNHRVLQP